MRNTFIGLGAAAAIIVVIFIISRLIPHPQVAQQQQLPAQTGPSPQEIATQASQVKVGFTGTVQIGKWTVICSPEQKKAAQAPSGGIPVTLNADGSAPSEASAAEPAAAPPAKKPGGIELGRCRSSLAVRPRNKPKNVALVAAVRLVKDTSKDRIALILHIPPVQKVGGKIFVALTAKEAITLPVLSCEKGQCVALGILEKSVYNTVTARPGVAVVVPIQANGQRMIVPLSMSGLAAAIEAMKRAA